jgi:hypothetical protein
MDESLDGLLNDLPAEAMAADLPERVREGLRTYRRREARLRFAARAGTMALGAGSVVLVWPGLTQLAEAVVRAIEGSASGVLAGLIEDPGMALWRLGESVMGMGSGVSGRLGTSGVLALTLLAIPAVLGLSWTLSGPREALST